MWLIDSVAVSNFWGFTESSRSSAFQFKQLSIDLSKWLLLLFSIHPNKLLLYLHFSPNVLWKVEPPLCNQTCWGECFDLSFSSFSFTVSFALVPSPSSPMFLSGARRDIRPGPTGDPTDGTLTLRCEIRCCAVQICIFSVTLYAILTHNVSNSR